MALPDKHPEYVERLGEWIQLADTYQGERAVKSKRLDYLPATEGMVQDGMTTPTSPGWKDYEAYLLRAVFHDVVKDAVKAMIGIMHNKPAVFKLPKRLEGMLDQATIQGEGLQMLLRRINVAQLVYGRCGLLLDAPQGVDIDKATPYISFYNPERVINWDAGRLNEGRNVLDLVVLDESGFRREGFTWKTERKYRVLTRGGPESLESGWERPPEGSPFGVAVKVNDMSMPVLEDFIFPAIGGNTLDDIPFQFIGANDLVPEPEISPLLGLSNLALAIYRGEADYRQTLYLQGQNTLVIVGGNIDEAAPSQLRVGNKGVIDLRIGGDAFYIGPDGSSLSEMRSSIENDKTEAGLLGSQFLDIGNDQAESGEALRIRVAARTTTIASVARAGAAGLEQTLKWAAQWVGEDPDEVSVEPMTDFADQTVAGAALLAFMQAKQLGLPLSLRSMHRMMQMNDMTEMDFEQEQEQIEEEASSMLGLMVGPFQQPITDDTFLDDGLDPVPAPGAGTTPGGGAAQPGQPPAGPGSTAPPNNNVPVKPSARQKGHTRGSPVPLKKKVGRKGASAGKTKNGA
jgi:Domain of unknown function (DUF4055)